MSNWIDAQRRISALYWAIVLSVLSVLGVVLLSLTITSFAIVLVSVGIPLLAICLPLTRKLANVHRRWAADRLGAEIISPYLPQPEGYLLVSLWRRTKDPATWRDLLWLVYNSTIGLGIYLIAVVYAPLALLFWWLPAYLLLDLNARVARWLLWPGRSWQLANRVTELSESRAETVDSKAAEIRRIERDLHDGAQAKLVVLGINLGLAEAIIDSDPATARQLLADARTTTGDALAELRDLVRGIHPPVLADRGLVGAVRALALVTPIPVEVVEAVPDRLPAPVESAGYFAVAEALTNVIKHSQASRAAILLRYEANILELQVIDDGIGGARLEAGSGLRGIESRLTAFDGTLVVTSPPGGPTTVIMELPCASSLPKTRPSLETG